MQKFLRKDDNFSANMQLFAEKSSANNFLKKKSPNHIQNFKKIFYFCFDKETETKKV